MNLKTTILATLTGTASVATTELDQVTKSAIISLFVTVLTQLFNQMLEERKERRKAKQRLKEIANK